MYCDLCLTEHENICTPPQSPERPVFAVVSETPFDDTSSTTILQRELRKQGLHWQDAHVTSVVKYAIDKVGVRVVRQAMPYLEAELEYLHDIGCKYVLALGATVYKALGGQGAVRDTLGVAHTHKGLIVYTCMHPGMALRSTAQADELARYLKGFANLVKGKAPELPEPEVVIVRDVAGVIEMIANLKQADTIAYDIETAGLDEQHEKATIFCIAYTASPDKAYVVLLDHPGRSGSRSLMERLLRALHKQRKVWVAHNGRFDNRWLEHYKLNDPRLKRDTILMAHLLDENAPKNVESVASRYLGIPSWGNIMQPHFNAIAEAVKKGEEIPYPPVDDLAKYAALDVCVELQLSEAMWGQMSPAQRRIHHFLIRVGNVLSYSESLGVYIDKEVLEEAIEYSESAMEEATTHARAILGTDEEEVKLGSSQWLGEILFERLSLPVVDYTPGGAPSTNESSLKRLRKHAPEFMGAIFDYRRNQKWLGSYLRPWSEQLTPDSRLRSAYNLTGTVTGRLSCTNMPSFKGTKGMSLHQVPRDGQIRNVIRAPEGRTLVVADYSQIELRVAAALAKEPTMIEAYHKGEDIHSLTASIVTGKKLEEVTGEDRQRAKAVNFGFLYGMGYRNFVSYAYDQYDMEFTQAEAQTIRNNFFRAYYGLSAWHDEVRQFVKRHGYIVSPLGRVRHLPDVNSPDNYLSSEAIRQGINSPVQATASDFTLAAMILIKRALHRRPEMQAVIVGQVHDSILVECKEKHDEQVGILVKHVMEKQTPLWISKQFGYTFPLPLGAEAAIGSAWGIYTKVLD